jgi:hypothetical protein
MSAGSPRRASVTAHRAQDGQQRHGDDSRHEVAFNEHTILSAARATCACLLLRCLQAWAETGFKRRGWQWTVHLLAHILITDRQCHHTPCSCVQLLDFRTMSGAVPTKLQMAVAQAHNVQPSRRACRTYMAGRRKRLRLWRPARARATEHFMPLEVCNIIETFGSNILGHCKSRPIKTAV